VFGIQYSEWSSEARGQQQAGIFPT